MDPNGLARLWGNHKVNTWDDVDSLLPNVKLFSKQDSPANGNRPMTMTFCGFFFILSEQDKYDVREDVTSTETLLQIKHYQERARTKAFIQVY